MDPDLSHEPGVNVPTAQKAAAGGGGGGGPTESELVTNAGILLWTNPETDDMFTTDAETNPVDKEADQQNSARWIPGVKPSSMNYWADTAGNRPQYRNAANGINNNPVVEYRDTNDSHALNQTGFTTADLFSASSAVYCLAGQFTVDEGGDRRIISDGWPDSIQTYVMAAGNLRFLLETSGGNETVDAAIDGNGLCSLLAWLHDGQIDYWANGTKQTAIESVANLNTLTRSGWTMQGITGWMQLRQGAGKASGAEESNMAALAAHLESLLGRA